MLIDNMDMTKLFQNLDTIMYDKEKCEKLQNDIIKESFYYHYRNNPGYQKYVDRIDEDITRKNIQSKDIPLLPSSLFKREQDLLSVSEDKIIKYCTSSGTLGSLSIVPRDEDTLMNFYSSISASISLYLGIDREGNHKVFVLGPDTEEAGDLWFSYVLSSMSLNFQANYLEKDNVFNLEDAYTKISEAANKGNELVIIGPPFRIIELCNYINENNLSVKLNSDSFVISAGGWKSRQKEAISRISYTNIVKETFHIDQYYIRDSFNMVELNSVVIECRCHQKHILPWMDVIAFDPKTNSPLYDGEEGILCFYDASSLSYPCFIMSEDYGKVYSQNCECGLVTKRFEITRRLNTVESRGCALKMAADIKHVDKNANTRFFKSYYRNKDMFKN